MPGEEAIARMDAQHAAQREADQKAAEELNAYVNETREDIADEYNDSERGDVRRQIDEAERIMRLPTPEALKAMGSHPPKDPTRFPSD